MRLLNTICMHAWADGYQILWQKSQEMVRPGLLAVLSPVGVGLAFRALGAYTGQQLLGAKAVASLLMFSLAAGALCFFEAHSALVSRAGSRPGCCSLIALQCPLLCFGSHDELAGACPGNVQHCQTGKRTTGLHADPNIMHSLIQPACCAQAS